MRKGRFKALMKYKTDLAEAKRLFRATKKALLNWLDGTFAVLRRHPCYTSTPPFLIKSTIIADQKCLFG